MPQTPSEHEYTAMTQQEFDSMLEGHHVWMRTDGQEGKRGNFRDVDLRSCVLAGVDLTGASLRGSCLRGMNLEGATFQDVDLAEAVLTGVQASGVNFQRANLSKAKLDGARLAEANLSFTTMLNCDLSGADLARANLSQASMREVNLAAANAQQANFSQAILRGATLTDAEFSEAILEHADLREANLTRAQLTHANLKEAQMRGAQLEGVSFVGTDFSRAIDMPAHYQMVAFQQRQEAVEAEKHLLEAETARVAAREAELLNIKREIEMKSSLLSSLKDEETNLRFELTVFASRARFFSLVWLVAIVAFSLGILALADGIPPGKLNVMEIGLLFGTMVGVLLLFILSAIIPARTASLLEKHVKLRDRKHSLAYNEDERSSESL